MPTVIRDFHQASATIASGAATSNNILLGGHDVVGLTIPALTSGYVGAIASPDAGTTWYQIRYTGAALFSAHGPGGTAAAAIASDMLEPLAGYNLIRLSASVAQASARTFFVTMK